MAKTKSQKLSISLEILRTFFFSDEKTRSYFLQSQKLAPEKKKNMLMFKGCLAVCLTTLSVPLPCVHAKSFQLCLTLCDAVDNSPPGSSVHGILQARILE